MRDPAPPLVCRCGHTQDVHEHYRQADDTECASCRCPAFRPERPSISPHLRRLLAVVTGVPALVGVCAVVAIWAGPGAVTLLLLTAVVVALYLLTDKEAP